YFGATGGGVWKTTDGGISWDPLFDKQPVSSIGAVAVADSDPNVIYVGTGEACIRGNISFGDGVYKSTDAGKTWTNVGLKDTRHIGAIGVGAVGVAERGDKYNIGIRRMNNDRTDVPGVFQADVSPGLPGVGGFVDTVSERDVAADAGFAGADIDDVGIRIRHGDGADGRDGLLIEERIPADAAIGGFPDASAGRAKVVGVRLARHPGHRQHAAATERPNKTPLHTAIGFRINLLRIRNESGQQQHPERGQQEIGR